MKHVIMVISAVLLLASGLVFAGDDSLKVAADSTAGGEVEPVPVQDTSSRVVVYYLHGHRRCTTCKQLESYSEEAVKSGFATELKDSVVIWRVVDFESEGNEHLVQDYGLYSQSLVLSRLKGGQEIQWKNLDKIWTLVGKKEEFMAYVQSELRAFLNSGDKRDG
jgi:hypothetical protein